MCGTATRSASNSGFEAASRGDGGGFGGGRTDQRTYLRGAQVTDADGIVQFRTIYPGAYPGRTVHVHVKVHLDRTTVLTSQLFFDEAVTEEVYARAPYDRAPDRDTFNDTDGIFDEGLVLSLRDDGDGVLGLLTLDVQRA
jgi:hypothetical protein